MKLHVFDLDGTLCDSSHRYRTITGADGIERIDLPFWRANEHKVMKDSPLPLAADYRALLADPEHYCIIATARVACERTHRWIEFHLGGANGIISRKGPNDTRGGAALKIQGLRRFFNLRQFQPFRDNGNAITVYEDNKDYLATLCDTLACRGIYIPSKQGH